MKPLISIIIPVYNSQGYLERCIESLRNQNYKNLELIFINDGSNDNSLSILEEYKKLDNRIKVINQSNQGASMARNIGLKKANGKYIGFVDSDDYVERGMFEELYNSLTKSNTELAMCNFKNESYNGKVALNKLPWNDGTILYFDDIRNKLIPRMIGLPNEFTLDNRIYGSVCRCLYSRKVIDNNKIRFSQDVKFMEDLLFNIKYLTEIKKVSIISNYSYIYTYNKSSATKRYMKSMLESTRNSHTILKNILVEAKLYENLKDYFDWRWRAVAINCAINTFRPGNNSNTKNKYLELKELVENIHIIRAFEKINIKKLSLKKKYIYISFKRKFIVLLYLYFKIAVKKESK